MSRTFSFPTKRFSGFTIVELIVVIVVIVILALIVVALYDNLTPKAVDVSVQSDLDHAMDQLEFDNRRNGKYPDTAAQVDGGKGFKVGEGTTLTYTKKPYGYCIVGSNPDANSTYRVRSLDRKVQEGDCSPTVTLLAGSPNATGYADGPGASALFSGNDGMGIDVAKNGDIYVSDFGNDRIRKITPSGQVSTFAGSGNSTCSTTAASAATINIDRPLGLAYDDRTDTLYFMACSGSRLYKATPDGMVSPVAGGTYGQWCNGTSGGATGFYWSRGLTMGPDGYLYVIATELFRICKINPDTGTSTLLAGSGTAGFNDASGSAVQFNWPWSAVFNSSGNLIVKDARNYRLRQVTPGGTVTTFSGSGMNGITNGTAATASFYYYGPHSLAIDPSDNIYLVESNVLRKVNPNGDVEYAAPGWNFPYALINGYPQAVTFGPDGVLYGAGIRGVLKIIL